MDNSVVTIGDFIESGDRSWPFSEFGSTGLSRWGGHVEEEFLAELQGMQGRQIYQEMRWNDPIVNAVFFGIEHSLRQVRYFADPASDTRRDKDNAIFVEENINDMSFSWDDTMLFILHMLEQGVAIQEIVYKKRFGEHPPKYVRDPARSKYRDGKIGWRKWAPRPVDTLTPGGEWIFDDNGGVQGISQTAPPSYKPVDIPIEKLLMFRTTPAPHNNPEGRSILRGMFSSYYYASQLREVEAIGIERDLLGVPIAYMGRDAIFRGEKSDYELLKKGLRRLRTDEQECLIIPRHKMREGGDTGIRVELLTTTGGGLQRVDVGQVISRYEKRMALAVLAQFILLGLENVGSFALAKAQKDFFSMAVGAWANQIAEVINRFAIPRLFKLNNIQVDEGLPVWRPSETGVPDLESLANFVNKMVQAQVLTPDDTLESSIRAFARLPQRKEKKAGEDREDPGNDLPPAAEDQEELDMLMSVVDQMLEEGGSGGEMGDIAAGLLDEMGTSGMSN